MLAILLLAAATSTAPDPDRTTIRQIDTIVTRDFYSADVLRERAWRTSVERATDAHARAATPHDREAAIHALLASLDTSHTAYLPKSDWQRPYLAAIFERVLRERKETCVALPVRVEDIGVWWQREDGRWFVGGLLDDAPAQAAGLKLGDEIVTAGGAPFDPATSFAGRAGQHVALVLRRTANGPRRTVRVAVRTIEPMAAYVEALRASRRIVDAGRKRIGYLRLWSGVGVNIVDEVRAQVRELDTAKVDGFVLDLRDGFGGVPPELVSIFDTRVPVIDTARRDGTRYGFDAQIRKPAAVLVDAGTRSGKEVFAHAVRKHGLATLVGEPTAGAMVSGTPYCLGDGGLLYLAVAATTIDGEVLEGRPVVPDVRVAAPVPYANGRDAALEKALEVLR